MVALPQVLGALTVESLVASKTFAVVAGVDPSAGAGDFQLLLTVRHFEAEYALGHPTGIAPAARFFIEVPAGRAALPPTCWYAVMRRPRSPRARTA